MAPEPESYEEFIDPVPARKKKVKKPFPWGDWIKIGLPVATVILGWVGSVEIRLGDRTSIDRQFRALEQSIDNQAIQNKSLNKRSELIEALITPIVVEHRVEQTLREKYGIFTVPAATPPTPPTPPIPTAPPGIRSPLPAPKPKTPDVSKIRRDAETWAKSQLPSVEQRAPSPE